MLTARATRVAACAVVPLALLAFFAPKIRAEETPQEAIQRAYQKSNEKGQDAAIDILTKYLDEHPKPGRARLVLGEIYEQSNKKEKAKKCYRQVIDADDEPA